MVTGLFTIPPPQGILCAPALLAAHISRALLRKGHEVTFYASEGSQVAGVPVETKQLPPFQVSASHFRYDPLTDYNRERLICIWDQYLLTRMFQAASEGKHDLLHVHVPAETGLPLASLHSQVPLIVTLHDPISPPQRDLFKMFSPSNQWYVSISNNQRLPAVDLQYAGTVYNGIEASSIPFSEKPGDYLLFVGRLIPEKGVKEAIETAKRVQKQLVLMGPYYEHNPVWKRYWEEDIKPHVDGKAVVHLGHLPQEKAYEYYRDAYAMIFPIKWEEPFGLVMVESMAAGTPVIAFRRGSVPEIIKDGETGFIVDTVDQMVEAVQKIDSIDRRACRDHVEQNFSVEKMVDGYEAVYRKVLDQSNA